MLFKLVASKLGRALVIAGGFLLAILTFAFGASKKREGRQEAVNDALEDSANRLEKGREAAQDLHDAGRADLEQRLRDNNSRW